MGSRLNAVNIMTLELANLIVLASFLIPSQALACGFFDIFSCFSGLNNVAQAEEEILPNSQNMLLLQAVISPNQDASSTKGEIAIVGGTSLSPESSITPDTKTADDDQISLYVVHSGDTLPAIAKMFGVSVNTIRWGNDLKGNTIAVGQTLVILPISGIQHVVKSGDTLLSIAKQHKGDLDEILQYNNLTKNSKLAIGDIIIIPDGEVAAVSGGGTYVGIGKTSSYYPLYNGY